MSEDKLIITVPDNLDHELKLGIEPFVFPVKTLAGSMVGAGIGACVGTVAATLGVEPIVAYGTTTILFALTGGFLSTVPVYKERKKYTLIKHMTNVAKERNNKHLLYKKEMSEYEQGRNTKSDSYYKDGSWNRNYDQRKLAASIESLNNESNSRTLSGTR